MDPNVLSATFRQLQQIKPYYTFPEVTRCRSLQGGMVCNATQLLRCAN
ncbi:MAG: hypothetical protein WDO06_00290 [Actinomycetota bacterium]